MSIIEERKLTTREKRKSTLTAYCGVTSNLLDIYDGSEIVQRIRTFSQTKEDELIEALHLLSTIKDSAIIVHGALGCSSALLSFDYSNHNEVNWYTTNLNERDTIMGGDSKLRSTVERAYKEVNPKVIFIVGTPVVAINNDDITSVILELEQEFNIPIIHVYTDGFKSKSAINGIDIVLHGLVKYLGQLINEKKKEDSSKQRLLLNVVSITEEKDTIDQVIHILEGIGIQANVLPRYQSINDLEKSIQAIATVALNVDEADILLQGLEEASIPTIRTKSPIGTKAIASWLTRIGKQLGKEQEVIHLLQQEEKNVQGCIAKQPLKGTQFYVELPPSIAEGVFELIEELGGEIVGITVPYIDEDSINSLKSLHKDMKIQVGNGQVFELVNILSKYENVYYITNKPKAECIIRTGVTPVSIYNKNIFFYSGIKNLINCITRAQRASVYIDAICKKESPYQDSWINKSTNWYVKQEVK